VEQLGERCGGTLLFHQVSGLLVFGQLAKHAGRDALDVLNVAVEQLKKITSGLGF
jgi:hypothetical protein